MDHVARDPIPVIEIERFTAKPGDVLFIHVNSPISEDDAGRIREKLVDYLGRYGINIPVVTVSKEITIEVGHFSDVAEDRSSE